MRLIDAEILKQKLIAMYKVYNNQYKLYDSGFQNAVNQIYYFLDSLPTIDPVKHGKWLLIYEDWRKQMEGNECSVCGYKYFGDLFDYCPKCGVKMDKHESEDK